MFGLGKKKYTLRWPQKRIVANQNGNYEATVYRIQALRDIPEHGVKAGDAGGFVSNDSNLSQTDSCWIADDAEVLNQAAVMHNAFVGGNASVATSPAAWASPIYLLNNARIIDNAVVRNYTSTPQRHMQISENAVISGNAYIENVGFILGSAKISDEVQLHGCQTIKDNAEIFGHAVLYQGVEVLGKSKVSGNVVLNSHALVRNSILDGSLQVPRSGRVENFTGYEQEKLDRFLLELAVRENNLKTGRRTNLLRERIISEILDGLHREPGEHARTWTAESLNEEADRIVKQYYQDPRHSPVQNIRKSAQSLPVSVLPEKQQASKPNPLAVMTSEHSRAVSAYEEILSSMESYEKDIVKIIKYPAMTDPTEQKTLALMIALKTVKRLYNDGQCPAEEIIKAVKDLEEKFLIAEFNAQKISQTSLSELERKKIQKAQDLLAIAADEASSTQEKKVSFEQAFKQLEGVIMVPEGAVDTFRVKIGLQEIEA